MVRDRHSDSASSDVTSEGMPSGEGAASLRVAVRHACEVGRVVAGEISPLKLERLADFASDAESPTPLRYRIEFLPQGPDRLWLAEISVEGTLQLTCERCLEPMTLSVSGSSTLQFVHSDAQAAQVGEDHEPVLIDEEGVVSIGALIEDEVLMAIPVVVRHEELCRAPWRESEEGATEASVADGKDRENRRENPFAVLAQLRQGDKKDS